MVIKSAILLPVTLLLAAAAAGAEASKLESSISISHSGSRGPSPVYEISIFPDGSVLYRGVRHVKRIGEAKARIDPRKYDDFIREFERIKFFSMNKECPMAMDVPTRTISVAVHGRKKAVNYNVPCDDIAGLPLLERRIEEAVDAKQWTQ